VFHAAAKDAMITPGVDIRGVLDTSYERVPADAPYKVPTGIGLEASWTRRMSECRRTRRTKSRPASDSGAMPGQPIRRGGSARSASARCPYWTLRSGRVNIYVLCLVSSVLTCENAAQHSAWPVRPFNPSVVGSSPTGPTTRGNNPQVVKNR
jgi:hypothetical protein